MAVLSSKEIEKELLDLSLEELFDLEEKIMQAVKKKLLNQTNEEWKKDFLEISTWTHLKES